jgi:rhodanese-related sulfurtransferase
LPGDVDRKRLRELIDSGAQLVEVLPAKEYQEDHLPGAISLPLRRLEKEASEVLDKTRPVVVYCWDTVCDLSPRAAWRLEAMGFQQVYDYENGKVDWMAAGLPTEGTNANKPRAGDVARRDVPTSGLDERLGDVEKRVRAAGWDACVVVNPERVVLGLLRARELEADPDLRIEQAMRPGPSTFRPYVSIEEMAKFMTEHDLENSPITTADGRLVGLLIREDAARALSRIG